MMQEDPNYGPPAADPAPSRRVPHRGSRSSGGGDSSSASGTAAGGGGGAAASASANSVAAAAPAGAGAGAAAGGHPPAGTAAAAASPPPPSSLPSKILLILTILLRILLYPLRKLSTLLFPSREFDGLAVPGVSDRAARSFVAHFRKQYLLGGDLGRRAAAASAGPGSSDDGRQADAESQQCPFVTTGYKSTLTDIVSRAPSSPLLLVYLHSPLHRDSDSFCRRTLSCPNVLAYLNGEENNGTMTPFGASVHTADGAHVAGLLNVAAYPFLALVNVKSTGGGGGGNNNGNNNNRNAAAARSSNITLELLLKMEGRPLHNLRPAQFLLYLQTIVRQHAQTLAEATMRRLQREEEANLRREQDREFQETLEADRAREAERQAEVERLAQEERDRADEERRAEEEKQDRLAVAMSLVGDEPPSTGQPPGSTARIRLTLPNGRRVDRRFRSDDTIEVVRAFLTVHFHDNDVGISNFCLSSSYPKRTFDDPSVTLQEGGLVPQAVLMVQDLDA